MKKHLVIALALALAACGSKTKQPDTTAGEGAGTGSATAAEPQKLYDRLGGKDAIAKVVDMFVANVAADERINAQFQNADITNLKTKLVDQICEASGGPCKYTGKNMKEAHVGMGITSADFDALVEDLVKAMKDAGVGEQEQRELLSVLGPMKPDIVTR